MIPTVVIGGERRIVDEDITPRLNRHGLDVVDVFPMDKEMGALPKEAQIFFFVTNMMSHRHNDAAKAEAERRGNVKVIYGTSKGSLITQRLIDAGYPEILPVNEPETLNVQSSVVRISNPKLPGGYYKATVMDGDIDEEKMMMMYYIDYGPEGTKHEGKVYTDVLLRREDYASGKPIDRLYDFLGSIGVELGKTNKGLAEIKAKQERLYGRPVYFQLVPAADGTRVVYLDAAMWKIKSSNQRRRYPVDAISAPPTTPTPTEETVSMPPKLTVVPPALAPVPAPVAPTPAPVWTNIGKTDEQKDAFERLIRYIATDPLVTKEDGARYLGTTSLNSTYATFWQTARRMLGVYSIRTSPVQIEREQYVKVCASLGITPVEWTERARARRGAPETTVAPVAPVVETPAPVVETPMPVAAPPVAETAAPSDDLSDLREILALLRDEMVKRDIRRMLVTPEGVDFTRVVTVTGKMEF
jgi:hypothetical protein